jgi:predicted nucleotide-binding protein (sugar kinase/HSP70/actin superfamily)
MTIGIPKALIYWKRPFFWEEFFQALGFEVLFSPPTNKQIVEMGVKKGDPETCFSNKVYWGHLIWLDKKCDLIFVPRLKTNEMKLEYCPKFFGIPDLARILVSTPLLTVTLDQKKRTFRKSLERLGNQLDKDAREVGKALGKALLTEERKKHEREEKFFKKLASKKPKIVLISHPYNLYDTYVNLRAEEKLLRLGVQPLILEELPVRHRRFFPKRKGNSGDLSDVDFHWEFAEEMVEKIREIFKYDITGGVEISSFQCGCDGVIKEMVESEFKKRKTPFLYLIIDEQTGEAGLQTRLEAFVDTIH